MNNSEIVEKMALIEPSSFGFLVQQMIDDLQSSERKLANYERLSKESLARMIVNMNANLGPILNATRKLALERTKSNQPWEIQ